MNTPTPALVNVFWTHQDAISFCKEIEAFAPECGCHVALTGGMLYKDGSRKDCDILFYRIRQKKEIDSKKLAEKLNSIGVVQMKRFGWMVKATYLRNGLARELDIFFPEKPLDVEDNEFVRKSVEASSYN